MVSYPVRTPPLYWAVIACLCGTSAIVIHVAGPLLFDFAPQHLLIVALAWVVVLLPGLYFAATGEYRTGRHGAITLSLDRIELPDPQGRSLRLSVASLTVASTHVKVRVHVAGIPAATVPRGTLIDLRAGSVRRRISTLTLSNPDHAELLLDDLGRVQRGEAPLGPDRPPTAPERDVRDRYDDALDAELERLG
jgi:hypothetical protein